MITHDHEKAECYERELVAIGNDHDACLVVQKEKAPIWAPGPPYVGKVLTLACYAKPSKGK